MAFSRGEPTWGAHLADELERLIALHDASTIAAVIVEPMQGSTGVIVSPAGYLKAAACGVATLDVYKEEGLFQRARELEPVLEDAMHALKGEPNVIDVRNIGMAAAVELAPIPDKPGLRGLKTFEHALENSVYV